MKKKRTAYGKYVILFVFSIFTVYFYNSFTPTNYDLKEMGVEYRSFENIVYIYELKAVFQTGSLGSVEALSWKNWARILYIPLT